MPYRPAFKRVDELLRSLFDRATASSTPKGLLDPASEVQRSEPPAGLLDPQSFESAQPEPPPGLLSAQSHRSDGMDRGGSPMASPQPSQVAAAVPARQPGSVTPNARPARAQAFNDSDVEMLARLMFAEGARQAAEPGVYLGIGNTVLNRIGAPGFPNTLQGVINQQRPNGIRQFDSVGGSLWNLAGNPGALTGPNATAYKAAHATANDLLYGSEYVFDDPTSGSTYFYSTRNRPRTPPSGFFTNTENSGRLRREYEAGDFVFLRDTQQRR